jgi:hypothetical protein
MAQPVQVSMLELNAKIGELLMECIKRAEREDALLAHIAQLQQRPPAVPEAKQPKPKRERR